MEKLLTDREVSVLLGRARSTLQKDRVAGRGIPFVRIGAQIRYRPSDVRAAQRVFRSTSEADTSPSDRPAEM